MEKEVAVAATVMKDKFVSLVSHDMNAPISTILGFLRLLQGDPGAQLNEGAKFILAKTIGIGEEMVNLIDDLLNISRLRTGALKLNSQFFDAKYLGLMMAANYSYLAGQKGIEIENTIPDNSRIYGDRALLAEAIQNLVTNAIKFCNKGDHITISLAEGCSTSICVRDTGNGIQPGRLKDIFNYDLKISTLGTAGETGTGLGLHFVKDIMELHGGELDIKSELGKGTLASLKLPYVRPMILVVDDDRTFRYLEVQILKDIEATIAEAENGEEALKMVESFHPHVVISDVKMPIIDGLELLRRLKGKPDTKNIHVIMVTGEYGMEIRDELFKLGAEDFVTKSKIDKMDFLPRVRRFVG
jgi:CheY-like chemotaxis protein/anti-sigma regulatory factor (Ser/Thr protein kinase)